MQRKVINKKPDDVHASIRRMMAAANFSIESESVNRIAFAHGTLLTQTASMLPKKGVITLTPTKDGTEVAYEIAVIGFAKWWILLVATVFFWLIFPPIIVYHTLVKQPQKLMDNLIAGV